MHPADHAARNPERPAIIIADTGETIRFADLDARSDQGAHLPRRLGPMRGDVVAGVSADAPEAFVLPDAGVATLAAHALTVRVGDGSRQGVRLGPVNDRLQYARVPDRSHDARDQGDRVVPRAETAVTPGYLVPIIWQRRRPRRAVAAGRLPPLC